MDDFDLSKLADIFYLYAAMLFLSEFAINRDLRRYTTKDIRERLGAVGRAIGRFIAICSSRRLL